MKYRLIIGIWMILGSMMMAQSQDTQIDLPTDNDSITQDNVTDLTSIMSFDSRKKQVTFSPDGSMIAVATQNMDYDYGVYIYNLATTELVTTIQGRMDFYRNLFWSPDNKRVAIISQRITGAGVQITAVKTYTLTNDRYMFGNSDAWYNDTVDALDSFMSLDALVWHPDSNMLAVAFNDDVRIYDGIQDDPLHILDLSHVVDLDWSADGRFLMTQTAEGSIRLWGVTP